MSTRPTSGTTNTEVADLLRQLQTEGDLTPQQQQWVAQQLARVSGQTTTSTPSLMGQIGSVGSALSGPAGSNPRLAGSRAIGAGIGLGLAALLRHRRQGQGNQTTPGAGVPSYDNAEDYTPGTGTGAASTTAAGGPDFTPPAPGPPSIAMPTIPGATMPPGFISPGGPAGSQLMMGTDRSGNPIHSNNGGQTWIDDNSGATVTGPAFQQTPVLRRGGAVRRAFARGGDAAEALPPAPIKPLRAILMRKPSSDGPDAGAKHHIPIPIISTTIVIAHKRPTRTKAKAKAKPEKKAKGGITPVPGRVLRPRKPNAIPPKSGPGNGEGPPAPFAKGGHVQVPRGSGVAERGKIFRGIY